MFASLTFQPFIEMMRMIKIMILKQLKHIEPLTGFFFFVGALGY